MRAERFEDGEPMPDQDPADYMAPAFEYELGYGAASDSLAGYGGGTFSQPVHLSSEQVMSDLFNDAAAGKEEARPATGTREDEREDEKAGAHSAAPGTRGPGRPG